MPLSRRSIDIRQGGLGDIWMRLVSLYVAAGVNPGSDILVVLPAKLFNAASCAFSDRLRLTTNDEPSAIAFTVRGLRDVLPSALLGRRYASPYGRVVIRDWNIYSLKDRINSLGLTISDVLGLVYSPPWRSLDKYQGFSEIASLPSFRSLLAENFYSRMISDSVCIYSRLQKAPISAKLKLPSNLSGEILVFPSGTGHQFMPLDWAVTNLPNATYAFFYKDKELPKWQSSGLKTVVFYEEPGDLLALSNMARVTLSTDSFPSHFLQSCASNLVVLLAELPRERVVSPSFSGVVVEAVAPCHPCPHLERYGSPQCKAGHNTCLNWRSPDYTNSILAAISSFSFDPLS